MILVFFVSLYFSEFIAKTYIFRDLSSYRPCQELSRTSYHDRYHSHCCYCCCNGCYFPQISVFSHQVEDGTHNEIHHYNRFIVVVWMVGCMYNNWKGQQNRTGMESSEGKLYFLSQLSTFCVLKGVKGRLDVQFNWLWRPRLLTERTSSYRVLSSQGDDFHFLNFFANTIPQVLTDFSTMICQL